jgi:hypothetical protein
MPRSDHHVIIFGEQQTDVDVVSLARVIVRFVRHRRSQPTGDATSTVIDEKAQAS